MFAHIGAQVSRAHTFVCLWHLFTKETVLCCKYLNCLRKYLLSNVEIFVYMLLTFASSTRIKLRTAHRNWKERHLLFVVTLFKHDMAVAFCSWVRIQDGLVLFSWMWNVFFWQGVVENTLWYGKSAERGLGFIPCLWMVQRKKKLGTDVYAKNFLNRPRASSTFSFEAPKRIQVDTAAKTSCPLTSAQCFLLEMKSQNRKIVCVLSLQSFVVFWIPVFFLLILSLLLSCDTVTWLVSPLLNAKTTGPHLDCVWNFVFVTHFDLNDYFILRTNEWICACQTFTLKQIFLNTHSQQTTISGFDWNLDHQNRNGFFQHFKHCLEQVMKAICTTSCFS